MTDFLGKVHARDVKVKVKICTLLYSLSITSMWCQGPGCCSFFWWWLLSSACWCSTGERVLLRMVKFSHWPRCFKVHFSNFHLNAKKSLCWKYPARSPRKSPSAAAQDELLREETLHLRETRRAPSKKANAFGGKRYWVTLSVFVSQKLVRTHRNSPFDSGLP